MATGFRIDKRKLDAKIRKALGALQADKFKADLAFWVRGGLRAAVKATPVRSLALIRKNQAKEYAHRINYIPSFHDLENPSLRVKEDGTEWLYIGSKWYNTAWRVPDAAWAALQSLRVERQRRLSTARVNFIGERAQARFLYRKSWGQVAASLGIPIAVAAGPAKAHSRHEPESEPPLGYGQWRGGKTVLSVVIYNPFLQQSNQRYKPWNGKDIIFAAMKQTEPAFLKRFQAHLSRVLSGIFSK